MKTAASEMPATREVSRPIRMYFIRNGERYPPRIPPASAARNGSQAKSAISLMSMPRSFAR